MGKGYGMYQKHLQNKTESGGLDFFIILVIYQSCQGLGSNQYHFSVLLGQLSKS